MKSKLDILYEDNHLIAVNKAAGEITQGDKTGDQPLPDKIKEYIKKEYNKPGNVYLGVIHRLDRPTSGAIVFSKTSKALTRMNKLFKTQEVEKEYWAIVEQEPKIKKGSLVDYLAKNQKQNKSYVTQNKSAGAKKAILNYEMMAKSDHYCLLKVHIETGRHHQIRVQLANMGCVIKGDVKYGARRANKDRSISLHARSLRFVHPVKKEEVSMTAKVPTDPLWEFFEQEMKK